MKMEGNIKWYKKNKGYGYITGADEETYFFEITDCLDLDAEFNEGDEVLFIPEFTDVEYARKVEKVLSDEQ